ncbi:hypothetical protein NH26_22465 [Flammeovirga pacifica]|uniref:Uncharacterized protein n=1 Tax=Flammeovirga pacifica TaxID=915059 RepID=A0A1S1YTL0_FLAPC|nr:hypothetical protein NH26_22465 [Flammeovirga pacifica]
MNYILPIIIVVCIVLLWMIVQMGWSKVFKDQHQYDDALAGRSKCTGCKCKVVCKKDKQVII